MNSICIITISREKPFIGTTILKFTLFESTIPFFVKFPKRASGFHYSFKQCTALFFALYHTYNVPTLLQVYQSYIIIKLSAVVNLDKYLYI